MRFRDNGDGTITDIKTGLMWQKVTAPGTYNHDSAFKYCENLTIGGYSDWRLPRIKELRSIIDCERCNPAIDPIFEAVSSWYWSSSTYVGLPGHAWLVSFNVGSVHYDGKTDGNYVRAVRSGS